MIQLQRQRYERKYFITERQAGNVRKFLEFHLEPDSHSAKQPDLSYPVHSIYLDSEQLATYWATVHCEKKRFKIRVRFYNNDPSSPAFFEIKRRENECILKQRAIVRRAAAPMILAGQHPEMEHLVSSDPADLVVAQRFCMLVQRLQARPKLHIAYEREAWISPESDAVRVTIDRDVRGQVVNELRLNTHMDKPTYPFDGRIVLEMKYTNRFPEWFRHVVGHFNLVQCGVPKYCGSIEVLGEEKLRNRYPAGQAERIAEVTKYF